MSEESVIDLSGGLCHVDYDGRQVPWICVYDPKQKWEPVEENAMSEETDRTLIAFKEAAGMANIEFDACGTACLRGLIEGMRYLYHYHGGDYEDSDKAIYRWFDKAGEWQALRPLP